MRVGIEHLGGFGHEPHAAECDHIAFEVARLARQFQAVAHGVGKLLDLRLLVVVRQQDRLAALFSSRISSAMETVASMEGSRRPLENPYAQNVVRHFHFIRAHLPMKMA